jgi:hypothetical protein
MSDNLNVAPCSAMQVRIFLWFQGLSFKEQGRKMGRCSMDI